MLYVMRPTQNKNDSINSILQYSCVIGKDCCVVFSASGFPYSILCPRQCKGKVATTYLKGTKIQYKNYYINIPVQKSTAVKASTNYKQ